MLRVIPYEIINDDTNGLKRSGACLLFLFDASFASVAEFASFSLCTEIVCRSETWHLWTIRRLAKSLFSEIGAGRVFFPLHLIRHITDHYQSVYLKITGKQVLRGKWKVPFWHDTNEWKGKKGEKRPATQDSKTYQTRSGRSIFFFNHYTPFYVPPHPPLFTLFSTSLLEHNVRDRFSVCCCHVPNGKAMVSRRETWRDIVEAKITLNSPEWVKNYIYFIWC